MTVNWSAAEVDDTEVEGRILQWPGPRTVKEDSRQLLLDESKVIPFRPRRPVRRRVPRLALELIGVFLAIVLLNVAIVLIYSGAL